MATYKVIEHKGKKIHIVDIANTKPEEAIVLLADSQKKIAALPPKSALIITDATNAVYNNDSAAAIRDFAKKNTPFVRASAVVGADGLRTVLMKAVAIFTKRDIKACKSHDEAMEWLISRG